MKYVIMCGGEYDMFTIPKQLSKINGERLVDRTIRLLKEEGIEDIYITSNDERFNNCDAVRLEHNNSFKIKDGKLYGYWLDAFYPFEETEKVTYLYGDVYYSKDAIKKIVNYEVTENTLFGTSIANNEEHKNWGEPFAFKVVDMKKFRDGIEDVKKLQDEGKLKRMAITWELYRYLNGLDVNVQSIKEETYVYIDDETTDIDSLNCIEKLEEKLKTKK